MTKTRDNHYVPQWHQKGFMEDRESQLCYLIRREFPLPNGKIKVVNEKKWFTPAQRFYEVDLYSILFGSEVNDDIERKLFGPIDENGSKSVWAFLTDDQSQWHNNFQNFFTYLDAQKLRTPKGLEWIKTKYHGLNQAQLMVEMQSLRTMHCTLWAEGVREFVSAEESDVKFILSDHPVTVYNYACPPDSNYCIYPNDPDITLKGTQTIFPLDKNRCLILTNLEYAKNNESTNPLEQRTNPTRIRRSMVNTINFINARKLTSDEVSRINYIIKSRAKNSIAAGKEDWLYPEKDVVCDWAELRHTLLPPSKELSGFGGEMYVRFEDGSVHYQDAFGREKPSNEHLSKNVDENNLGRNDFCGCGSGKKYKNCCSTIPVDLRTSWNVISIRERNIMFCNCIKDVLGLTKGKVWNDVRKELSEEQIKKIYEFYTLLWPRDTDVYSLLPKSDGKYRGLYSGALDVRTITLNALPVASFFDEFLIQNPVTNPINIKPEFSPLKSPEEFKYQALKEFLFMLDMEPFIYKGLINLIPDPSEFDIELKRGMMNMINERRQKEQVINKQDYMLLHGLMVEDVLNSLAGNSKEEKIQFISETLGIDKVDADELVSVFERESEQSPLMMLQALPTGRCGQFMMNRMEPNYEMALLIAQVTGSVLVTDSGSRLRQFMSAQHRNQGVASYPWSDMLSSFKQIPIDVQFLYEFNKSQGRFASVRALLKSTDRIVRENTRNDAQLAIMKKMVDDLMGGLNEDSDSIILKNLKICSPDGGFSDVNVQRLLASSSCLKYDNQVRAVYGIDILE
ncbi:DUF4238 domain-containing protein [Citrobacter freundii]|nr:DUF4238 domain-containing protein [Citrobacter freundii]